MINTIDEKEIWKLFEDIAQDVINLKRELDDKKLQLHDANDRCALIQKVNNAFSSQNGSLIEKIKHQENEIKLIKRELEKFKAPVQAPVQFELQPVSDETLTNVFNIATLDQEDMPQPERYYIAADFMDLFCFRSGNIKRVAANNNWPENAMKRVDDSTFIGFHYEINGAFGREIFDRCNPTHEVFYKASHLDGTKSDIARSFKAGNASKIKERDIIVFKGLLHSRYIRHSTVIKYDLPFQEGTESYRRFQKYNDRVK